MSLIEDDYGDVLEVDTTCLRNVVLSGALADGAHPAWVFTPAQARKLIKAIKKAVKEAEAK